MHILQALELKKSYDAGKPSPEVWYLGQPGEITDADQDGNTVSFWWVSKNGLKFGQYSYKELTLYDENSPRKQPKPVID
jgi:hypothetical protein